MNAPILADEKTQKKVASLAAYHMTDAAIGGALFLSVETVAAIRETDTFKQAYAEKVAERVNRAIDLEEGWDSVEELAITKTLQALEYNSDPRFSLQAAAIANRAQRRTSSPTKTLDATQVGNKVIILSMNKRFVSNNQTSEQSATLVIEERTGPLQKKRVDLPAPKKVSELLQITKSRTDLDEVYEEMEDIAARAGVDASMLEDDE